MQDDKMVRRFLNANSKVLNIIQEIYWWKKKNSSKIFPKTSSSKFLGIYTQYAYHSNFFYPLQIEMNKKTVSAWSGLQNKEMQKHFLRITWEDSPGRFPSLWPLWNLSQTSTPLRSSDTQFQVFFSDSVCTIALDTTTLV